MQGLALRHPWALLALVLGAGMLCGLALRGGLAGAAVETQRLAMAGLGGAASGVRAWATGRTEVGAARWRQVAAFVLAAPVWGARPRGRAGSRHRAPTPLRRWLGHYAGLARHGPAWG
ncbi:hypothetical protein SAMN02745204_00154 [Thermomonas hydrothermalis]|uniref:Uncharacterized protein n=1 Tax=Thermomonas hydrothermalis TaxID=213588 RepID=A0A1M4SDN9_9GAMM|nr:hypothetical protein SAMN02745204_00154 [Thermomonas hydrothermalis]